MENKFKVGLERRRSHFIKNLLTGQPFTFDNILTLHDPIN